MQKPAHRIKPRPDVRRFPHDISHGPHHPHPTSRVHAVCPFMIYGELVQRWRLRWGAQQRSKGPREAPGHQRLGLGRAKAVEPPLCTTAGAFQPLFSFPHHLITPAARERSCSSGRVSSSTSMGPGSSSGCLRVRAARHGPCKRPSCIKQVRDWAAQRHPRSAASPRPASARYFHRCSPCATLPAPPPHPAAACSHPGVGGGALGSGRVWQCSGVLKRPYTACAADASADASSASLTPCVAPACSGLRSSGAPACTYHSAHDALVSAVSIRPSPLSHRALTCPGRCGTCQTPPRSPPGFF